MPENEQSLALTVKTRWCYLFFKQKTILKTGITVHELSIAQSMLDIVLQEAARHGATKVERVVVNVGAFSGVVPHSLRFSFDLVKKDTAADGAELVINQAPVHGECAACGHKAELSEPSVKCPACGEEKLDLTGGRDLFVEYIEAQ